ncbi:MAG TPA: hypothetical protein VE981_14000 [Planctomycetota bacterium]|nr:hypothetical protein [Planctomycetota bacterium]
MSPERNQLPVLSRQLESLSERAGTFQSREQEEQDWFSAVLASLRSTHERISRGFDFGTLIQDFVLEVTEAGKLLLKQAGLPVPVDDDYLEHVFLTTGLQLSPGQVLVLEPRMAKWAIEESLWGLELDRALTRSRFDVLDVDPAPSAPISAWSRKRDLITANLIAEELLERENQLP